MNCWFCESCIEWGDKGPYCPFADCPAVKASAGPLHHNETERWCRMREGGRLWINLIDAGFVDDDDDDWPDDHISDPSGPSDCPALRQPDCAALADA